MSTEHSPTTEPRPTTDAPPTDRGPVDADPTEVAVRGRHDPWADEQVTGGELTAAAARAPRQFEPTRLERLRNLMDDENAYCN